jgi:hypothetical protein
MNDQVKGFVGGPPPHALGARLYSQYASAKKSPAWRGFKFFLGKKRELLGRDKLRVGFHTAFGQVHTFVFFFFADADSEYGFED